MHFPYQYIQYFAFTLYFNFTHFTASVALFCKTLKPFLQWLHIKACCALYLFFEYLLFFPLTLGVLYLFLIALYPFHLFRFSLPLYCSLLSLFLPIHLVFCHSISIFVRYPYSSLLPPPSILLLLLLFAK